MKCPRCVRPIGSRDLVCRECGYGMEEQDMALGSDSVYLDRLSDSEERLSSAQHAEIGAALDRFEADFPQLFLAVYLGPLPRGIHLRQFGFWLLNRAAIASLDITRPNENGALLLIDSHSGSCGIVTGYLLECYFTERELAAVLEAAKKYFPAENFTEGILAITAEFSQRLRRKCREARKNPAKFRPPPSLAVAEPVFVRVHDSPRPGDSRRFEEVEKTRTNDAQDKEESRP